MKNGFVVDLEGDSLTPTRIWCIAAHNLETGKSKSTIDYDEMRRLLEKAEVLVMHNGARFDVPVMERLLNVSIKAKIIDTLALSWYLYPDRMTHGLEDWGEDLGVQKPTIIRWDDPELLPEYIHRCEEDVKINTLLWKRMWKRLLVLYETEEEVWKFLDYLSFKMDCAREQERSGWKLDVERCRTALDELETHKAGVVASLLEAMPQVNVVAKKARPAKPFKQDGTWSVHGAKWFQLLREHNLPEDYQGEVEVVVGTEPPKPSSPKQVKDWLYGAGWVPETFKYVRDKETGETREIPQINLEHGQGICPSISRLYDKHPEFQLLEGLGVVSHRISILNGFLDNVDADGYIKAQIAGLTNTLRFKHKTVVNLPGVDKPYGELIRGCLIAPEGHELCGSDMSSLEDRLKCHYIYPHDPEYAAEISTPGYDSHLSLAVSDGKLTEEQMEAYKAGTDKSAAPIRKKYKSVNYSAQYGAGGPRIAIAAGTSEKEGKALHKAYWKKNWAIKVVAAEQYIKTVKGQMWLKNPINGFYYSLRYEKDIFSTLVQGTASYVFDLWVMNVRKVRPQLTGQFHDEFILCPKKGFRDKCSALIRAAMKQLNEELKLNRELDCEIQYGDTYAAIH